MGIIKPLELLFFLFGRNANGSPSGVGISAMYKFTGPDTILSSGLMMAFLILFAF